VAPLLEEFEEPLDDVVLPLPDEAPLEEALVPLEATPPSPASARLSARFDVLALHATTRARPTKAAVLTTRPGDAEARKEEEEEVFTARRLSPQPADRPHRAI
jgi:hypothetical protein